jgi:hypothetical protein
MNLQPLTKAFYTTTKLVKKNSPLILMVAGLGAVGASVFLTYKKSPELHKIVEDVEQARENGDDIDRRGIAIETAKVLALPAVTLASGVTALLVSYRILTGRVTALSSALSAVTTEYVAYKKGAEKAGFEYHPEVEESTKGRGENKKVVKVKATKYNPLTGEWFDRSDQYAQDDHEYNMQFIHQTEQNLSNKFYNRGYLLLNDVLDEFGYRRTKVGAIMGWTTTNTSFGVNTIIHDITDESGGTAPAIFVEWPMPYPIYNDVDL